MGGVMTKGTVAKCLCLDEAGGPFGEEIRLARDERKKAPKTTGFIPHP